MTAAAVARTSLLGTVPIPPVDGALRRGTHQAYGPAMNWAYLDNERPVAFAHRGGNTAAPENTLAAFEHAIGLGYRYLETDVHVTSDGVLVAAHDAGLDRVAGEAQAIADLTWDELQKVDLGDGHRVPRFVELLDAFPHARLNVEPKTDEAVDLLASTIVADDALGRVCIGSFNDARIARMRKLLGPELCTSAGPRDVARIFAGTVARRPWTGGHGCLQIPSSFGPVRVSRRLVDKAHELELHVHVWTINDETEMRQLLDLGVDGVMTDNTELLRRVMVERGEWTGDSPSGEAEAP